MVANRDISLSNVKGCWKTLNQSSYLCQYFFIHSGEKPYKCEICEPMCNKHPFDEERIVTFMEYNFRWA